MALQLRDMCAADVAAVLRIERQVHSHPWTRGMFDDALSASYLCKLCEQAGEIVAYAVLMPVVDELHLLDIGIAAAHQRKGMGSRLLRQLVEMAGKQGYMRMLLEVRRSNEAALALYRRAGFAEIGVRRGYYAAHNGREDALVMEFKLQ